MIFKNKSLCAKKIFDALKYCDFPDSGVCFGNHANKKAGDRERAVRRSRRPLVCDCPNLQSNVAVLKNQTQGRFWHFLDWSVFKQISNWWKSNTKRHRNWPQLSKTCKCRHPGCRTLAQSSELEPHDSSADDGRTMHSFGCGRSRGAWKYTDTQIQIRKYTAQQGEW